MFLSRFCKKGDANSTCFYIYIYIFFYFQTILVNVNKHTIIQDLLESVCGKRQLNLEDHYVRVKLPNTPAGVYTIPEPQEIIRKMVRFVNIV